MNDERLMPEASTLLTAYSHGQHGCNSCPAGCGELVLSIPKASITRAANGRRLHGDKSCPAGRE